MQPHATILNQDDAGSSVSRLMQHDPKGCTPTLDLQGEVAVRSLARPKDRAPYRCPPALPLYLKVKGRAMVLAHQTMGALSESSSALTAYGPYRDLDLGPPRGHAPSHVKGVLGGGLPSLSFGLPSSRPFGVAVRSLRSPVATLPARLSLWSILLPLLRSGRSALCAHPAVPMGHPPPSPLGWPYTRPCPTGYVLLPRCAQAVARPCPTGYVLLPRCAQAVSALVCHQCRKHNGGSRHPWAEVRSGRGKRGHQYYGVTPS